MKIKIIRIKKRDNENEDSQNWKYYIPETPNKNYFFVPFNETK